MKLLMIQPPHAFVETDLPPVPGVCRDSKIVRCRHCGVMGFTPDDKCVHLFQGPKVRELARTCKPHNPDLSVWHVRITCPNLCDRGPAFAPLMPGTTHMIHMPPESDNLRLPGLWVRGYRGEPVKLLPGEYLPVQIRVRKRRGLQAVAI